MNLQTRRMIIGLIAVIALMFSLDNKLDKTVILIAGQYETWQLVIGIALMCFDTILLWFAADLIRGAISKKEDQGQNYNININSAKSNNDETNI